MIALACALWLAPMPNPPAPRDATTPAGAFWPLSWSWLGTSALALDNDLRRPMFSAPSGARRAPQGAPDPRYRRAPVYQPAPRGFFESLFGAPQRPQYQPGYRPAPQRQQRPPPKRVQRKPPVAAPRAVVEKTEFVYLLWPAGGRLAEGLEEIFASRPAVEVRRAAAPAVDEARAAALLAPLPTPLARAGREAMLVIEARPAWMALAPQELQTLQDGVSAAAAQRGGAVVWVGLPPAVNAASADQITRLNAALKAAAQKQGDGYVDAWAAFAGDSGGFAAFGPSVTGEQVRLREDADGALTRAGARKLAHFIATEIRRLQNQRMEQRPALPSVEDPFALPGPQSPRDAPAAVAARPAPPPVGPVLPLNRVWVEAQGNLLPLASAPASESGTAEQDAAAQPPQGRADDFRWPRRQATQSQAQ